MIIIEYNQNLSKTTVRKKFSCCHVEVNQLKDHYTTNCIIYSIISVVRFRGRQGNINREKRYVTKWHPVSPLLTGIRAKKRKETIEIPGLGRGTGIKVG